jgi:regulator of RNase E activity RraA
MASVFEDDAMRPQLFTTVGRDIFDTIGLPGDILFGDRDGVLVMPREAERVATSRAIEKANTENRVRTAVDAFDTFGVM